MFTKIKKLWESFQNVLPDNLTEIKIIDKKWNNRFIISSEQLIHTDSNNNINILRKWDI